MKIIFDIQAVDGKRISIKNQVELLAKIGEMVAEEIDTDADIKWIIEAE